MNMYTAKRTLLAVIVGFALATLLPTLILAETRDAEAIADGLAQYETRFNQGEIGALAQLFGKNVVYYGPLGRIFEGRAPVKRHYQGMRSAGFRNMTVDVIEIVLSEDAAYDIARYTITGPAGKTFSGYHLAILEKEDGEWRVRRTLANTKMSDTPSRSEHEG